jgi:hypothetical protein
MVQAVEVARLVQRVDLLEKVILVEVEVVMPVV